MGDRNTIEMRMKFKGRMGETIRRFVPKKVREKKKKPPLWWNKKVQRARKK